jgi:hypothetical protein
MCSSMLPCPRPRCHALVHVAMSSSILPCPRLCCHVFVHVSICLSMFPCPRNSRNSFPWTSYCKRKTEFSIEKWQLPFVICRRKRKFIFLRRQLTLLFQQTCPSMNILKLILCLSIHMQRFFPRKIGVPLRIIRNGRLKRKDN